MTKKQVADKHYNEKSLSLAPEHNVLLIVLSKGEGAQRFNLSKRSDVILMDMQYTEEDM